MKDSDQPPMLSDLGEEEVVRRLVEGLSQKPNVLVGPGDDCAVVDTGGEYLLLLKTDAVVEGIHFLSETESDRVGWKAAARVVSDFAAMGGEASELLITIAAAGEVSLSWVEGLYLGISRCAERFQASVVGGETVSLPTGSATLVSVSGTGRVERNRFVTRSQGRPNDSLWVTGRLGGSYQSGRHLDFIPRVAEGQWLADYAHAMMDLSDGLQRDLPRLAHASGCGFVLDKERLPCHQDATIAQALSDGEDMELLFAAPEGEWIAEFRKKFPKVELTRIGQLTSEGESDLGTGGWQHFTKEDE
jgi:thiamine-monophosphate kinase